MAKLLVVERKGEIQRLLERRFSQSQVVVEGVRAIDAVLDKLRHNTYDVFIWDVDISTGERSRGFDLFEVLSRDFPQIRVLVVENEETVAPEGMKGDAYQSIQRPLDEDQLCGLVNSALQTRHGLAEGSLPHEVYVPLEFEGIIAISLPMRAVIQRILEATSSDIPVLITGETGTGKDLVAAAIHKRSKRQDKPYIVVNTGAMTPELIASELFGHEKGAYTGAFEKRPGLFEQAHGGTVFLDEISTMDEKAQISLLRVLEDRTFRRVGGEKDIRVDVRVIAATNENLEEAVKEKRFREDLYYRLDVFRINLPPLRARPGAVTLLTNHFVSYFETVYKKNVRVVSPETYRCLRRYSWPGNVRELKNVIQRAVLMCKGEELAPDLVPARIREAAGSGTSTDSQLFPIHVGMTLNAVEKEFIQMTLVSTHGNKKEAATILGISRRALYNKLKKYGFL